MSVAKALLAQRVARILDEGSPRRGSRLVCAALVACGMGAAASLAAMELAAAGAPRIAEADRVVKLKAYPPAAVAFARAKERHDRRPVPRENVIITPSRGPRASTSAAFTPATTPILGISREAVERRRAGEDRAREAERRNAEAQKRTKAAEAIRIAAAKIRADGLGWVGAGEQRRIEQKQRRDLTPEAGGNGVAARLNSPPRPEVPG